MLRPVLHIILPVFVLTIVNVAGWSRYLRASMLEVLRQDYVRTARAKGLVGARGDHQARPAQRPDPLCHPGRLSPPGVFWRRHYYRIDLQLAGDGPPVLPAWAIAIIRWRWRSCSS